MKRILYLLLIAVILIPNASAGVIGNLSLPDILPNLIAEGIVDKALGRLGEYFYQMSGNKTSNSSFLPDMLVTSDQYLLANPWVQSQKDFSTFWYEVFYVAFLLLGGAAAMFRQTRTKASTLIHFTYKDTGFLNDDQYIEMASWGLIIYGFALYGMDFLLKIEWLLSKSVSYMILDVIPPAPENGVGLLIMGGTAFLLSGFMIYRYFILNLTGGYLLLLLGLWLIPYVRGIIQEILLYTGLMLYSRFALLLVALGGVSLIQYLPYGLNYFAIPWFILGGTLVLLSFAFVVGPLTFIRWMKSAKTVVMKL